MYRSSFVRRLPPSVRIAHGPRPAFRWLCLLLGVSAAACISLAPPAQRPALPVPDTYEDGTGNAAGPAAGPSAAATGWRDYVLDPALRALLEQALANSRDLRAAVLRVAEAQAIHGIQRADRLPTLFASADAARSRVPAELSPGGQALIANQFQVGVGFNSWELDFWGRVRNLDEAALQNFLATEAARRAATVGLLAGVAGSYLRLREFDERLALARRAVASREASLRIFRLRVEAGATSRLELTQVELLWQKASALVLQLEQARAAEAHALDLLVGAPMQLAPSAQPLDDAAVFRPLAAGLPSALVEDRPDIVAAEHALAAARANIGAARAAFFPRIALTGAFGTASVELDGLFGAGSQAWTFAPSLSLPIFDGGRRRAALDLAEVRRQQAVVGYEHAIQAAFRDVADALSAQCWLAAQVETARATLATQAERARLATLRYDSGAARYLEVLDAERDLLAAEQQLVQSRRALLAAQLALYAALGGGSLAPPAEGARG